ncbi:MAG TPA: ribonuclease D, partial [Nakamurella sp.]
MTGPDPAGGADAYPLADATPHVHDRAGTIEMREAAGPVPLTVPQRPVSMVLTASDLSAVAGRIAAGSGPMAVDTERASGFRYGGRAYLVQLGRADIGDVLIDPVGLNDFGPLQAALAEVEWVIHAATQDLPCLADLGLRPLRLFDTELAGRLAGLERVGLGPMAEQLLGISLAKGHSAADWSRRPLPLSWLDYAALDVEVLVDLRHAVAALLHADGKLEWAEQEFAALTAFRATAQREDPWRRTSGIHRISDRRTLAAIRELWTVRDDLARRRDLAPHRVLPDSAIIAAATALPKTAAQLSELDVFSGPRQRRQAGIWLSALDRARAVPDSDLPPVRLPSVGPPPAPRWVIKDPAAAARLAAAREGLTALSGRVRVPVENLVQPELVRRVLWQPPDPAEVPRVLADGGARPWQVD